MLMKHHLHSAGRQIFQHELIAAPLLLSHSMSSCLRNIRFCTASKSFIMGILNVYIVLKRQSYQAAIIFVKKIILHCIISILLLVKIKASVWLHLSNAY